MSECERLVSSPLLVLSREILESQVAATLILKSIHPFKWRAQFQEFHPHKSIFPFTFQITNVLLVCFHLQSMQSLPYDFLFHLLPSYSILIGANWLFSLFWSRPPWVKMLYVVFLSFSMGLLFLIGFYVSLTWFLCS